jgi:hypothetical protein
MQGKRSGVATRFRNEQPAAIPVHCFAHSLNLYLQDAGRNLACIRDALETVREITNLIRHSPERLHLFSSKFSQAGDSNSTVNLKPLSATRWTARTAAIDAILKHYKVLLEEIHATTRDEYGLKAGGLLQALEKFSTLFGLRLSHRLFSAAEQLSLTLQKKEIALQDAITAVEAAKSFFKRIRSDEEFDHFYDDTVSSALEHKINQPELPRYRKHPTRYEWK